VTLDDQILSFYASFIEENLGIVYSPDNYYQLLKRIEQVAVQLGFDDVMQMHDKLKNGIYGHAKTLILDIATNNETLFFRDRNMFIGFKEFLAQEESPFSHGSYKELKVWSAACSTGQEPYTLSFILNEWQKEDLNRKYSIYATDFSERVLEYSRKAEYTQLEVQRGIKTRELIKYFEPSADESTDNWCVKPEYRKHIRFDQLNLQSAWPLVEKVDFIFLRNVLIYFDLETKAKIIAKMVNKLNDGGLIVLGSAESMVGLSDEFDIVKFGSGSFYRKKAAKTKIA
jgi:chemotaxis protein methyltransferase CheR